MTGPRSSDVIVYVDTSAVREGAPTESLEYHLDVGGPRFQKLVGLITMESIDIYGRPSDQVLARLRGKARMLGHGRVSVHSLHAGFTRPA